MAQAKEPIVIVGGGRAAASLIDAYREEGGDALITVVSTDDQPPYNRPPLSKGVLRGEMEPLEALVHTAEEYDDLAVELRLETQRRVGRHRTAHTSPSPAARRCHTARS